MALANGRGLIVCVKTERHASLALPLLCLTAAWLAGCTYYFPHSLVATNIRTTDKDALTSGSKRVEAEVCGNRVLWIPVGPDPRMTAVMAALQEQVTSAIGFEDIRIDISFVNYVYPLFWQQCVQRSAFPLFAGQQASVEVRPDRRASLGRASGERRWCPGHRRRPVRAVTG